ncbi:hypothetical protein DOTSEDRAFT_27137 [Dothistroma septosporum NZE10]|uniref:Uncharacterized protein n=1 Tax=Dothistroma septosporum (strain NZE10 / CBS 128990) TaxID=675120 RepID=N1PD26_DOTSN|nr:hypothetical protein DOTSEDRAFT_27137 [Dothistroma septosporum NZE10]
MSPPSGPPATWLQMAIRTLISIANATRGGISRPSDFTNGLQALSWQTRLSTYTSDLRPSPRYSAQYLLSGCLENRNVWMLPKVFAVVQKMKAYFECSVFIPSSEPMLETINSWLAENVKVTTRSMSLQTTAQGWDPIS